MSSLVGKSYENGIKIIKYLKKNNKNLFVVFNPSSYVTKRGINKLDVIKLVDCIIVNKEESQELLNTKESDLEKLSEELYRKTKKMIVITDGKNGACCFWNNKFYFRKARKIKVVESTGAGDAFSVGFVYGIISKRSINKCLEFGIRNAESVIKHIGAKNKLLREKELIIK